jgi:long-chain acyl-CoA synthetase
MLWKPRPRAGTDTVVHGETVPQAFWNAVGRRGSKVALRQKELGIWREVSWQAFGAAARDIAMGLAALGLRPGEVVSILSNTRKEWLFADLGAQCAGLVTSGIYPTDSITQCEYLCSDSNTRVVFVEDDEQLDKILAVRDQLPELLKIVILDLDGLSRFADPQAISLAELRELGQRFDRDHPDEFDARLASRKGEDVSILVYTSGTTGRPKGAMLSHRNLVTQWPAFSKVVPQDESDSRMAFLPLCHVVERQYGAYFAIHTGTVLNFVENPETVPENVREIAPTILLAVPRIWEKFYSAVTIALAEAVRPHQLLYAWAIAQGHQVVDCVLAGRPVPASLNWRYRVARWLALDNLRKFIGIHRCKFLMTGSAPIAPDLIRWYLALGVPMVEGWGQTESAGAGTMNLVSANRLGTTGKPLEGIEIRVADDGEILLRGSCVFMGYLNLPEMTAETIDADGWLHTGDVGKVSTDGYVTITDRIKDIIITAGGKNITPSEIENELKFSPYITDAVIIGDRRPYLTALVMIDHENVEKFAQDRDVAFSNYTSLTRAPEVLRLIEGEIARVNAKFARVEQIKSFRLIETQLTAEDEELTPTMKLKRKFVNQKYAELIQTMYVTPQERLPPHQHS